MFDILPIEQTMRNKVVEFIRENWGSSIIVSKGKIHSAETIDGYLVLANDKIIGLITFEVINGECEIVSLDSLIESQGVGTRLIEKVIERSREYHCKRICLVTTNDNTKAIRYYQRRGFCISGLYLNAINESRRIKPEIPILGFYDIPILHEIEFEKIL